MTNGLIANFKGFIPDGRQGEKVKGRGENAKKPKTTFHFIRKNSVG